MTEKMRRNTVGENIVAVTFLCLCVYGCVSWNNFQGERHKRAEQEKLAEAAAETQRAADLKTEREAKDKAAAAEMKVPYELYIEAHAMVPDAATACQRLIKDRAEYGAENNWIPSFNWHVGENRTIGILGDDMTVRNAFGTERKIKYFCGYDMQTKKASIISIK